MRGTQKISTLEVTEKDQPSPCLRSKMGIASVAIPTLSGNYLPVRWLVIVMPCSLISHSKGNSKTMEQVMRYSVIVAVDLVMVAQSKQHVINYLMVMETADHMKTIILIKSLKIKMVRKCSLTRGMHTS
jgi:hypothetical protein